MKIFNLSNTGIKRSRKKGTQLDNMDYFAVGKHRFDPYLNILAIDVDFWELESDALALKENTFERTVEIDSTTLTVPSALNTKDEVIQQLIIATALEWNNITTTSGDKITLKNATLIDDV